ncbi:MAG TPA: tetratricopeptide repeat protein, partial [Ignavibacteria bacterium]
MNKEKLVLILLLIIAIPLVSCKKISSKYFDSGRQLYLNNNYEKSLSKFDKAVFFDDSKKNREYRGYAYCALEKYDLGIQDFNIALSNNTCYDVESYMRRGICYYYIGNYQESIKDFREAIKRNCKHRDYVFFLLGGAQKKLSDYVGAIRSFGEAIILDQNVFEYYFVKASTEYDYKDYYSAINTLNSSFKAKDADRMKVYFMLGNCDFRLENYSDAIISYTLSILSISTDKETEGAAYLNRGLSYINRSSYENACADFSKALEYGNDKAQEMINTYCNQKFTDSKPKSQKVYFECSNCNEINFRNPEYGYYDNYTQVLFSISVINNTNYKLWIIKVRYRCIDSSGNETDSGTYEFDGYMHPLVGSKSVKRESVDIKFPAGGKIIFEVESYKVWPCPTDDP